MLAYGGSKLVNDMAIRPTYNYFKSPETAEWQTTDQMLDPYLDKVFPKPESPNERTWYALNQGVADTAGMGGLGPIKGGAQALQSMGSPTAVGLGNMLSQGQVLNAGIGGASAAGGQYARDTYPDSPLAQIAGSLAPAVAGVLAPSAVRSVLPGNPEKVSSMVQLFDRVGASPTLGQATGNKTLQGVEGFLGKVPFAGGVMANKAESQIEGMRNYILDAADKFSPSATPTSTGRRIFEGVTENFVPGKRAVQTSLYNRLNSEMDTALPVDVPNFGGKLGELTTPVPGAGPLANSKLLSAHPDIQELNALYNQAIKKTGGKLSFDTLKEIRSRVGEKLYNFELGSDKPTAQLKQLYGALSDDMAATAKAAGPKAEAAFNRANQYTKALNDRIDTLQNVINKQGGMEKIWESVTAPGANKFGASKLNAVMKSLPEEARNSLTASFIRERLGKAVAARQDATGQAFSADTFLTNYSKLSREAKQALFGHSGPDFVKDMDGLAQVTATLRESSKKFANASGTGAVVNNYNAIMALIGHAATGNMAGAGKFMVGGVAAPYAASKILTNKNFVSFLARSSKDYLTNPRATRASVASIADQMAKVGKQKKDQELVDFAADVRNASAASEIDFTPDPAPTRAQQMLGGE
jgi:hypothetical protein